MPTYELSVILRQMTRPEVVSTLKRTAETILNRGGIIRKLENLGTKPLPYKISEHGQVHRTGSYFLMHFDCATSSLADFREEYNRDIDIVRANIFKVEEPTPIECTLDEESLPPAYRKDVIQMMEIAKKREKPKYDQKSGLDYYPFQNSRRMGVMLNYLGHSGKWNFIILVSLFLTFSSLATLDCYLSIFRLVLLGLVKI